MAFGFVPSKINQGHMQGWEYLPAYSITPKVGMALYFDSGYLKVSDGTTSKKPTYISMLEASTACTAGDLIPVIRIQPDALYDVPTYASQSSNGPGTKVTIHSDGLQITATTTNGTVEIVDKHNAGTSAGDIITVRIP